MDNKTILAWLDMQRDAVNTEIVYALQSEQKQYHGHLKIINWLADRVKDLSAVEYFFAKDEMCDNVDSCEDCVLGLVDGGNSRNCVEYECWHPRLAVEIVKRWKEERE